MSLSVSTIILPSAHFNGESTLPPIYGISNSQQIVQSKLDQDDELFVGYGFLDSIFPYRMQDLYDRANEKTEYIGIVLENKYLKAVFLPEMGGRLWSLYDKIENKDLLFENTIIRPCNLAVRNAWLSGGIEFNCGMVGHHPYTCSRIFASETKLDDGTPVLRMYEFERIRGCVYQMDFFLPDDSKMLYARMKIVNPNPRVVPMYWWTNMAVREDKNSRDVIDADETYNNANRIVGKNPVPIHNGIDITYPTNNPVAIDYFWKIPNEKRKYTALINKEGYGFIQTSTSRLKGRKLFVWGQGEGGSRWQEFLTEDNKDGRYVEIQAGLAHSQYECIPMPPKTTWEWLEAYGAIHTDGKKIHGDWKECREEVNKCLENILPEKYLEELLKDTKKMSLSPATKTIYYGSGWGKLENLRRQKCGEDIICPHLDFGELTPEQSDWVNLLENNTLEGKKKGNEPPISWMLQSEWTAIIEKSTDCHEKYLHLAAIYIAEKRFVEAGIAIDKAISFRQSSTSLFIKAQVLRINNEDKKALELLLQANEMLLSDLSLARYVFSEAYDSENYNAVISAYEKSPENIKKDGRTSMLYAFALTKVGRISDAEKVLHREGGLNVTDIREGEISITKLYVDIEVAKAKAKGIDIKPEDVVIPKQFDFRMNV